ncbi:hypothetical protein M3Y99_00864300 [Aphelenchoides fujianensis]|nr:hypothetical protein M3Y99_00864300 [Aphelenchoides fujianensis]
MSSDESSDHECPLCMEPFDPDDKTFYPCQCHYQICRFCWHRLRTDENGLCPACRQPYPENPVNFQPVSGSEMQKGKSKTKQRQPVKTKLAADARKHLAEYRVLQKNLVYVVGLSHKLADAESLKKPDYFGRFGKILKVVIGSSASTNGSGQTSVTAYVTYAREEDALRAIAAVNNVVLDNRVLRVSLGTTKYCSTFLRGQVCTKTECMYLHDVAEEEISFTKEDMHAGKHNDYERKLLEQLAARTQNSSKSKAITPVLQPRTEPSTSLSQTDLSSIASSTKENDAQSEGSKKTRKAKLMADAGSRKSSPKPDTRSRPTSRASSSASFASSKSQGRTNVEEIPQETRPTDEWNPPPSQPASAPEAQPLAEVPEPQKAPDSVMTTCGEFERRMLSENPVTTGAPIRENGTNGHNIDDDDLGFDPYSISAKALADMLIEEKEQGSPKFSYHEHTKLSSPPTSAKLQHMGANRSTITLDDIFTASRTSAHTNTSPYANLNAMPTAHEPQGGGGESTTNGRPPAQPRLFKRQSTAPHMPPPQPQYYAGHPAQQQQPKFHAEHEPNRAMLNGGGGYNLQMHEAAHADYLRLREFAAQVVGGYRPDQPYVVPHPAAPQPRGDAYGMGPTYAPNGYAPAGNAAPNGMERYEMHYDPMQQQRKPPYAQNKPNGTLNMNECREEFKALLPNVNSPASISSTPWTEAKPLASPQRATAS